MSKLVSVWGPGAAAKEVAEVAEIGATHHGEGGVHWLTPPGHTAGSGLPLTSDSKQHFNSIVVDFT